MDLNGRHILVLGLGESGLSMARHLAAAGATVSAADTRESPPGLADFRALLPEAPVHAGPLADAVFDGVDLVAVSPGVPVAGPMTDPAVAAARARGLAFVGDVELFAWALAAERAASGYAPRVLAITGTNGKTTVTSLTVFLANRAGKRAVAAGNISPAVLDAWAAAKTEGRLPDIWVLELSSFQLETTESLRADVATVLNVSEDHLDRHGSLAAYAAAKARIFAGDGVQLLNRDDARSMAMKRPFKAKNRRDIEPVAHTFGTDVPKLETDFGLVREPRPGGIVWLAQGVEADSEAEPRRLMPQDVLRIRGAHNAANALAALALNRAIGLPLAPMLKALAEYAGLDHRVQTVAEQGGVRFVDDSKGTNVGATQAALAGLGAELGDGARIVLIAGGDGKGQDFSPLATPVARFCRAVMLIGRDAAAIRQAIGGSGVETRQCDSLEAAVAGARAAARPGDVVLLSPACASFDMFRNYAHRAEAFVAAVRDLGRGSDAGQPADAAQSVSDGVQPVSEAAESPVVTDAPPAPVEASPPVSDDAPALSGASPAVIDDASAVESAWWPFDLTPASPPGSEEGGHA